MTHREILEKILFDRKIKKQDFAVQLGYGKNNYTNILNKDNYTEKMIKKISEALGISPSVFREVGSPYAPVQQIGNGNAPVHPSIGIGELRALYEQQLADKEKIIRLLEQRIAELEGKR